MARVLPPASSVREAPTNNQSAVPVTATRHCPVPVLPRRAKTSFPGRGAAPLRFAAPSAWVQKGSRAGLPSAGASAVTLAASTRKEDRRAAPATPATGLRRPARKTKTQEQPAETRCPPLPRWLLCVGLLPLLGPAAQERSESWPRLPQHEPGDLDTRDSGGENEPTLLGRANPGPFSRRRSRSFRDHDLPGLIRWDGDWGQSTITPSLCRYRKENRLNRRGLSVNMPQVQVSRS
jgi:hypothetical protein